MGEASWWHDMLAWHVGIHLAIVTFIQVLPSNAIQATVVDVLVCALAAIYPMAAAAYNDSSSRKTSNSLFHESRT